MAENAALALDENWVHMDFIPPLDNPNAPVCCFRFGVSEMGLGKAGGELDIGASTKSWGAAEVSWV